MRAGGQRESGQTKQPQQQEISAHVAPGELCLQMIAWSRVRRKPENLGGDYSSKVGMATGMSRHPA